MDGGSIINQMIQSVMDDGSIINQMDQSVMDDGSIINQMNQSVMDDGSRKPCVDCDIPHLQCYTVSTIVLSTV